MTPALRIRLVLPLLALLVGACTSAIKVSQYPTPESLFTAGLERYNRGKIPDAITAFEKLTFDLPTRDTLLPLAHWYLGHSRRKNAERLLAAQSFIRLAEQHPADTLADDAMYLAALSYREMWRRPELDSEYGQLAQSQFRLMQGLFADSPWADSAAVRLLELDEWFARKDFATGMHYYRRRAYDSAILYFQDVVRLFPNTDEARKSMLQLVRIYRLPVINYQEDAVEVCATLRAGFPTDPGVLELCKLPVAEGAPATGR